MSNTMLVVPKDEREAVVAEYDRLKDAMTMRPVRIISRVLYGIGVISAVAGALVLWRAGRNISMDLVVALAAATLMAALAGVLLSFFARGYASSRSYEVAERAIAMLADGSAGPEEKRRAAAVAALAYGTGAGGPWASNRLDTERVRMRLGGALGYVERVEWILREERGIRPVVTKSRLEA